MTELLVRCPSDPLAQITIDDAVFRTVAIGSAALRAEVVAGLYAVTASSGGRRNEQLIRVGADAVDVELELERPQSTIPETVGHDYLRVLRDRLREVGREADAGLVVSVVGGATDEPSAVGPSLELATRPVGGEPGDVVPIDRARNVILDARVADHAIGAAAIAPGTHVLSSGRGVRAAMAIPVFPGWNTLVFMSDDEVGPVGADASMLAVPRGWGWDPNDRLNALSAQLAVALMDPSKLTPDGLSAFDAELEAIQPSGPSPLARLAIAHLELAAGFGKEWERRRIMLERVRGDVGASADVFALDVIAAEQSGSAPPEARSTVSTIPVFARSADALLRHEARRPGTIDPQVGECYAARLASPVWFRWALDWTGRAASGDRSRRSRDGREITLTDVDRHLADARARSDAAMVRLLAYVADDHFVRGRRPDELLDSEVATLVEATGLPAATIERASSRFFAAVDAAHVADGESDRAPDFEQPAAASVAPPFPPPDTPRWPPVEPRPEGAGRSRLIKAVVVATVVAVAVVTVAILIWLANRPDAEPPPDTASTVPPTAETTSPSTTPASRPPAANIPPVASDDAAVLNEDEPITIDVLGNDRDDDGDALDISIVEPPGLGQAEALAGGIAYTPDLDATGIDRLVYRIDDRNGGSAQAVVTIRIEPVNDAPVATEDAQATVSGEPVRIEVLANDTDADGDELTAVLDTPPPVGAVTDDRGGGFVYDDNGIHVGRQSFTYSASDGETQSAPVAVSVTVYPALTTSAVSAPEANFPPITIGLSGEWDEPIGVDYNVVAGTATAGDDYSVTESTVTFLPGETTKPLAITVVNESLEEVDEAFTVNATVRYPDGITRSSSFEVVIEDDDFIVE